MNLAEKYRPTDWSQLVGLGWLQKQMAQLRRQGGLGGRAYWLAGPAGGGKTTVARLIASEVAEPWAVSEMDPCEVTTDWLRSVARMEYSGRPIGGKGWVFIVNEAHGLKPSQIRQLLTPTDTGNIPPFVAWVFTTTIVAMRDLFEERLDAHPLLGRCEVFDNMVVNVYVAAEYVRGIAQQEGLDGQPLERYVDLARDCEGSIRMMLSRIQRGRMKA